MSMTSLSILLQPFKIHLGRRLGAGAGPGQGAAGHLKIGALELVL